MLCASMKMLSHDSAKNKTETVKAEFLILHFYWSFSSDTMAVKGLMLTTPFSAHALHAPRHLQATLHHHNHSAPTTLTQMSLCIPRIRQYGNDSNFPLISVPILFLSKRKMVKKKKKKKALVQIKLSSSEHCFRFCGACTCCLWSL